MAAHPPAQLPDGDRLRGWKEIGNYLKTSDRTAQRWERTLRLPVQRVPTAHTAVVFASKRALDDWVASADGRAALSEQDGLGKDRGRVSTARPRAAQAPGLASDATRQIGDEGGSECVLCPQAPPPAQLPDHAESATVGSIWTTAADAASDAASDDWPAFSETFGEPHNRTTPLSEREGSQESVSVSERTRMQARSASQSLSQELRRTSYTFAASHRSLLLGLAASLVIVSTPSDVPAPAVSHDRPLAKQPVAHRGQPRPAGVRVRFENGATHRLWIQLGDVATCVVPGGQTYVISAQAGKTATALRISRLGRLQEPDVPVLTELGSWSLLPGALVDVQGVPGVRSVQLEVQSETYRPGAYVERQRQ